MSEASLERRLREADKIDQADGRREAHSPTDSCCLKHESKIRELEKKYEDMVSTLSKDVSQLMREANTQISSQRDKIKSLEQGMKSQAKSESTDCTKWLTTSTLASSLLFGVVQRWLLLVNIKCVFWDMTESLLTAAASRRVHGSRKNRKHLFLTIIFVQRLKALVGRKRDVMKEFAKEEMSESMGGRNMLNRLLAMSRGSESIVMHLFAKLNRRDASDESDIEKVFASFLSVKVTEVSASVGFNLQSFSQKRVDSLVESYNKRLSHASSLLEELYASLQLKDKEIELLKRNNLQPSNIQL